MCGDAEHGPTAERPGLTRRRFGQVAGGLAAASLLPRMRWQQPARAAAAPAFAADGTSPVSMAMHIHSSFSEFEGSMEAHVAEAARNAVDVVWWTDHDWRMSGYAFRNVVHFTSLTAEAGDGKPWVWKQERTKTLTTASVGGIVDSPASPLDTVPAGSLRVRAQSSSASRASLRFYAESKPARWNYRGNLAGQALYLEVLPQEVSRYGFLELMVTTSRHEPHAGRPAGDYSISYRLGGAGVPGSRVAKGLLGVVTLAVTRGQWNSVVVRPDEDIAALWPDLDARDSSLFGIRLGATSFGTATSGCFDYLRFSRATSGDIPLHVQQDIGAALTRSYPGVAQRQGLEVSYVNPHINWFGGAVSLPDYSGTAGKSDSAILKPIIADIHARGGITSYNHPFGVGFGTVLLSSAEQDRRLANLGVTLLNNKALDNDLIEVGYPSRSGVDLAHHVALWDVCSRNALFLTGNGTTDDHDAIDWLNSYLNWVTSAWAASQAEPDLLAALRAGRAWFGSLSGFRGSLDLLADGSCPMGSVSVSTLPARRLLVMATDLPAGGSLRVVQGVVDYAGTATPRPSNRQIGSYPAAALATGSVELSVDTSTSSYVRTEVLDSTGSVVGLSNPIWLLQNAPPNGIPAARAC